jgi:hypothetical protein
VRFEYSPPLFCGRFQIENDVSLMKYVSFTERKDQITFLSRDSTATLPRNHLVFEHQDGGLTRAILLSISWICLLARHSTLSEIGDFGFD